ncbi:hypothetical protein CPB83DRAFT_910837 [Crepidotus variabilis]|uniref:Transmembrane protein n=1 Tax=Crepidotus variabilis TaxID=179855 RepID=A0A9P6E691_9AGAR|nr:hypothetical protein CPB83DRAFT_910837 [Crepidotus variabilis]
MSDDSPTDVPLLPPSAGQILSGCLAVTIWDTLCYLRADFQIVFLHKFTWRTLVFLMARHSTLGYLIFVTIFTVSTGGMSCNALQISFRAFLVLARTSTTLLILLRVIAIYHDTPWVKSIFLAMWAATLGGLMLLAIRGITFAPSGLSCTSYVDEQLIAPAMFIEILTDTIMCLAILYKLGGMTWKERGKSLRKILRPPHPLLTDIFLQDTLIYAWLALLSNVAIFIACFVGPTESVGAVAGHPGAVALNLISLRIYRNMKLGAPGLLPPSPQSDLSNLSGMIFNAPVSTIPATSTSTQVQANPEASQRIVKDMVTSPET